MINDTVFLIPELIQNCGLQLLMQFAFDLVRLRRQLNWEMTLRSSQLWICYDVMYHHVEHTVRMQSWRVRGWSYVACSACGSFETGGTYTSWRSSFLHKVGCLPASSECTLTLSSAQPTTRSMIPFSACIARWVVTRQSCQAFAWHESNGC